MIYSSDNFTTHGSAYGFITDDRLQSNFNDLISIQRYAHAKYYYQMAIGSEDYHNALLNYEEAINSYGNTITEYLNNDDLNILIFSHLWVGNLSKDAVVKFQAYNKVESYLQYKELVDSKCLTDNDWRCRGQAQSQMAFLHTDLNLRIYWNEKYFHSLENIPKANYTRIDWSNYAICLRDTAMTYQHKGDHAQAKHYFHSCLAIYDQNIVDKNDTDYQIINDINNRLTALDNKNKHSPFFSAPSHPLMFQSSSLAGIRRSLKRDEVDGSKEITISNKKSKLG